MLYSQQLFADAIEVDGKHIEYRWKDDQAIWYFPSEVAQRKTKEESYDTCDELLAKYHGWQRYNKDSRDIYGGPICSLLPPPTEDWVLSFSRGQKKFETLEETELAKPPSDRMNESEFKEKFSQMKKMHEVHCPASFAIFHNSDDTVVCRGKPGIKCRKGYNMNGGFCTKTTLEPYPLGQSQNEGCQYGGSLDKGKKHTEDYCDGMACSTQHYCKVEIKNIRVKP